MRKLIYLSGLILVFLLVESCQKELLNIDESSNSNNSGKSLKVAAVPPFYFPWDSPSTNFMPTVAGQQILLPWANGASRGFSDDILYDVQQTEGWTLLYNQFDPRQSSLPSNPFFVLYNKYRGLMRVYTYITTNGFASSTSMIDALFLSGSGSSNTPLLNYLGNDIVVVGNNNTGISQKESSLLATGTWYASQYEMAYDPNTSNLTYQNLGLNFSLGYQNITSQTLGGSLTGTIDGTVTTLAPGGLDYLFGQAGKATIQVLGTFSLAKAVAAAGTSTNFATVAKKALTTGAEGSAKNVLSAIFGGGNTTSKVNLTINANLQLNGVQTSKGSVISPILFGIPGTSNSQSAQGFVPGYNSPMGVFYLSAKPKVKVTDLVLSTGITYVPGGFGSSVRKDKHTYSMDNASYNILFNPAVTSNAQIQNIQRELVMLPGGNSWYEQSPGDNRYTLNLNNPGGIAYYYESADGSIENIGSIGNVITGLTNSIKDVTFSPAPPYSYKFPHHKLGIRISFDVVPNNGTPKSKIIKTFEADQVFL